ncbi:MAG TPA: beta-galactosidase [Roseiflexaceae bacterium]|nr:beta-galactosidase [Roseiflexaceae bacterium]
MTPELRIPQIIYGGDYNPEQWPEEVWEEDARLMREAGVNLVSLGVFAWARLEPRPGRYDFGWLDRAIDLLHAHDVAVNLATATAAPPPWLARQNPEILPVTADGIRLWHGSRRHYCPTQPIYREHARRLVTALAQRYGTHPALRLWHIDNEYACHVAECFCDSCAAAFRKWLRGRYGTLDALNNAWGTAFWGQIYSEWEEIIPPRRAPYMIHPGHQLDWRRFCSDAWLDCFEDQRAILRQITPDIPLTTNLMGLFKPLDYWRWAERQDIIANDSYPDPSSPDSAIEGAIAGDLMRSLGGGRPWLLMEQATAHVNWRPQNATKRPGQMRLGSYQALARGADGVMFFQWRASKAGGEQFHAAMLPHAGTDSRVWREVVELGGELTGLTALRGSRVAAEVAIALDWPSWWALEIEGKPSVDLRLAQQLRAWYAPLFARNTTVDLVRPEADLSRYRLVLAPNLFLITDTAAANLLRYVEEGGTLAVGCFSGIVDERGQVRTGGYPAPWRRMLGLRVEEFAPFPASGFGAVTTTDGMGFGCRIWVDLLHLTGAEPLALFADGFYAGRAAVTHHRYGLGHSYYVGTCLDVPGMAWLTEQIAGNAGLRPPPTLPPGIEQVRRDDGQRAWRFLLNHGDTAAIVTLHPGEHDLLGTAAEDGALILPPLGVAILEGPLL